jgi:hypothetical protein
MAAHMAPRSRRLRLLQLDKNIGDEHAHVFAVQDGDNFVDMWDSPQTSMTLMW